MEGGAGGRPLTSLAAMVSLMRDATTGLASTSYVYVRARAHQPQERGVQFDSLLLAAPHARAAAARSPPPRRAAHVSFAHTHTDARTHPHTCSACL